MPSVAQFRDLMQGAKGALSCEFLRTRAVSAPSTVHSHAIIRIS